MMSSPPLERECSWLEFREVYAEHPVLFDPPADALLSPSARSLYVCYMDNAQGILYYALPSTKGFGWIRTKDLYDNNFSLVNQQHCQVTELDSTIISISASDSTLLLTTRSALYKFKIFFSVLSLKLETLGKYLVDPSSGGIKKTLVTETNVFLLLDSGQVICLDLELVKLSDKFDAHVQDMILANNNSMIVLLNDGRLINAPLNNPNQQKEITKAPVGIHSIHLIKKNLLMAQAQGGKLICFFENQNKQWIVFENPMGFKEEIDGTHYGKCSVVIIPDWVDKSFVILGHPQVPELCVLGIEQENSAGAPVTPGAQSLLVVKYFLMTEDALPQFGFSRLSPDEDACPLTLTVDYTNQKKLTVINEQGNEEELPAMPVVWAICIDGTLTGFQIVNRLEARQPYQKMKLDEEKVERKFDPVSTKSEKTESFNFSDGSKGSIPKTNLPSLFSTVSTTPVSKPTTLVQIPIPSKPLSTKISTGSSSSSPSLLNIKTNLDQDELAEDEASLSLNSQSTTVNLGPYQNLLLSDFLKLYTMVEDEIRTLKQTKSLAEIMLNALADELSNIQDIELKMSIAQEQSAFYANLELRVRNLGHRLGKIKDLMDLRRKQLKQRFNTIHSTTLSTNSAFDSLAADFGSTLQSFDERFAEMAISTDLPKYATLPRIKAVIDTLDQEVSKVAIELDQLCLSHRDLKIQSQSRRAVAYAEEDKSKLREHLKTIKKAPILHIKPIPQDESKKLDKKKDMLSATDVDLAKALPLTFNALSIESNAQNQQKSAIASAEFMGSKTDLAKILQGSSKDKIETKKSKEISPTFTAFSSSSQRVREEMISVMRPLSSSSAVSTEFESQIKFPMDAFQTTKSTTVKTPGLSSTTISTVLPPASLPLLPVKSDSLNKSTSSLESTLTTSTTTLGSTAPSVASDPVLYGFKLMSMLKKDESPRLEDDKLQEKIKKDTTKTFQEHSSISPNHKSSTSTEPDTKSSFGLFSSLSLSSSEKTYVASGEEIKQPLVQPTTPSTFSLPSSIAKQTEEELTGKIANAQASTVTSTILPSFTTISASNTSSSSVNKLSNSGFGSFGQSAALFGNQQPQNTTISSSNDSSFGIAKFSFGGASNTSHQQKFTMFPPASSPSTAQSTPFGIHSGLNLFSSSSATPFTAGTTASSTNTFTSSSSTFTSNAGNNPFANAASSTKQFSAIGTNNPPLQQQTVVTSPFGQAKSLSSSTSTSKPDVNVHSLTQFREVRGDADLPDD